MLDCCVGVGCIGLVIFCNCVVVDVLVVLGFVVVWLVLYV